MPANQPPNIRWGAIVRLVGLIIVLVAANLVARHFMETLNFTVRPGNEDAVNRAIMISATLYTILLAVPFVPGAEIGIGLMAMLGPPIALLVYLCTVSGLCIAFVLGRLLPLSVLANFSRDIKLERTSRLLREIEPMSKQQRLALLVDRAPKRFIPLLLRYRYLALAVALNIPGNYLIGGGGGIALFAGVSRLYSVSAYLLTIALAVAPVPLAVFFFGADILD
ncbi:MAG: hypothetical protein LJE92_16155 [Gammaproteobacteria bacterium]|jgi:hypothetical protein|nr:hypothetical protein [Gammaproteobacteria bacterium]